MSIEFKKLDDQVKADLQSLYNGTNKDVGQLSTNIGDLFDKTRLEAKYPDKYLSICNTTVITEASNYFKAKGESSKMTDGLTTDYNSQDFVF